MKRTAIVFGATGLIGRQVLQQLILDPQYDNILSFVRREGEVRHEKIREQVIDFTKLDAVAEHMKGDVVFSCFGTNITRSRDKSQWRFSDVDVVIQTADICKKNGAKTLAVISSIGANPKAGSFYLKLKGEMESGLQALGYEKLLILRPSFLLGRREKIRWHEEPARWVMQFFGLFMWGKAAGFKAIHAKVVARAMIRLVDIETGSQQIYASGELRVIGKQG